MSVGTKLSKMKKVMVTSTIGVELFLGEVGFWLLNGAAYLANPADVQYYISKFGVEDTPKDVSMYHKSILSLWKEKVQPIIKTVLSMDYVPCSNVPASSSYADLMAADYFGLQILHSDQYLGQFMGMYTQTRDEFIKELNDPTEWRVVEIQTKSMHFKGSADRDWRLLIK